MLSALKRLLFRPRAIEQGRPEQDYEAAPGGDTSSDEPERRSSASKKQTRLKQRRLFSRAGDNSSKKLQLDKTATAENLMAQRPLTSLSGRTGDSCDDDASGSGSGSGGASAGRLEMYQAECNNATSSSENCSSNSQTSSSSTSCSSTSSSSNRDEQAGEQNFRNNAPMASVMEDGDKAKQQQQQQQQPEQPTKVVEDYELEEENMDDFEDEYNDDESDAGPVAFIAEAPPKQQSHQLYQQQQQQQQHQKQHQQQQQQRQLDKQSFKPSGTSQYQPKKSSTPQAASSHHHQTNKTDVDQLLTGSASQQQRKDTVRGNLEELKLAESVNYRSVVYEYSFRIPDTPANKRIFTDPDDRRIEAIARSCDTQIQLERTKPSLSGQMRTRKVTIQAADLHSLEKCCRQFDDRFPHFYVSGGLGQSSKSIKRVYVDDLESTQ